jgi:pimeloyl-ACP methyl ester carboxylesterase
VTDSRTTIVFLHGTRLTGASWAVEVAALADEFHCLAPDLPGHGTAATEWFTLAGAAQDVADLIERDATDGRAILVGLSLGGYVAMDVAARWPERVAGLAVSGATAEPVGPRALFYRALATVFDATPPSVLGEINRRFFAWRYPPRVADPILGAGFDFDGGAVALRALVGERFRPRLAAYPGPSLLINGEYDLFFRPTEASFARVAANPRRVLIRRSLHLTPLDQPEAFTAVIRTFARSVAAADSRRSGGLGVDSPEGTVADGILRRPTQTPS